MPQVSCGFDGAPGGSSGRELLISLGPTLAVDIGFDQSYNPYANPHVAPIPGITAVQALVDTGAMVSCIDNLLASQLQLPVIDRAPVSGIHGSQDANRYLAQIHVPPLGFTIYGEFVGVDLRAGGQVHSALMGRTFLQNFTLIYNGQSGAVTISS